jgi:hypothetical protein
MIFYIFTSDFKLIKEIDKFGVDGVLHTYNAYHPSPFITIPKELEQTNIKHMIAIRPYTISPQLLSQISRTIDKCYERNVLQINLISGWIKENEKNAGGILGLVNDDSSKEDRLKYLVEYVDALEDLEIKNLDYYISVTNELTFNAAVKHNSKMIIDYKHFEEERYQINGKRIMIVLSPNKDDGTLKTHEELLNNVKILDFNGIKEIIFPGGNQSAIDSTLEFIKKYKGLSDQAMVE